jgi:GxxExxY protein
MYITQQGINDLAYKIIGCAIEVNKQYGPGLLESIYENCLVYELTSKGLKVQHQVKLPVLYKGVELDNFLQLDLLVEDVIIIELKAVEELSPIHEAQLLTYLKLADKPKGLLINFNSTKITDSVKHFVTDKFAHLPK